MSKPAIVYQALNLINDKCYIGVTARTLKTRTYEHAYDARMGRKRCVHFHRAINAHGLNAFRFSVLAVLPDIACASDLEERIIAAWKPEYNISPGGCGSPGKRTPEQRAIMKINRSGAWKDRPNPFLGCKHTEEAVALMREKANPHRSLEHLAALRDGMLRAAAARCKPVICIDSGEHFHSASAAAEHYGWKPYAVANAIGKNNGRMRDLIFAYEIAP